MQANPQTIRQVFSNGGDIQYRLPYFQREYTWGQAEWQTLLDDILATYTEYVTEQRTPEHFMGSLVRISDGVTQGIPSFTLVDGQQRLTTISLLLCAIRSLVLEASPDAAPKMSSMLINRDEREAATSWYKLLPTEKRGDQAAYRAVIQGTPHPPTTSRILGAYNFLRTALKQAIVGEIDLVRLYETVLQCLQVVTIDLDHSEQPYKIFESLNGKGKPLTPADLIRNYIAMSLSYSLQEKIFETHWRFIDDSLEEQREVGRSGIGELTAFFRHYLAVRTRNLYAIEHIYERFRDRMNSEDFASPDTFVEEIAVLHRAAVQYDRFLRPEHEPDIDVRIALQRLQGLDMSTAFPFMLYASEQYEAGVLTKAQWLETLSALENYFVRRILVGRQANYLNSMFPRLSDDIDLHDFSATLRQSLAKRQCPTDEEVRLAVRTHPYPRVAFSRLTFVLQAVNRRLSEGKGAYTMLDGAPTIEHIMPQTLNEAWRESLGPDSDTIHDRYLHTLGNLTLVTASWNAKLSNGSFVGKREALCEQHLRLNSDYFSNALAQWDEQAILTRAEWLVEGILAVWPALAVAQSPSPTVTVPVSVTISDKAYPVATWREVLMVAATVAADVLGDEFETLCIKMPWLIAASKPTSPQQFKQLGNGYWLNVNHDKNRCVALAQRILNEAGIGTQPLVVEEKPWTPK